VAVVLFSFDVSVVLGINIYVCVLKAFAAKQVKVLPEKRQRQNNSSNIASKSQEETFSSFSPCRICLIFLWPTYIAWAFWAFAFHIYDIAFFGNFLMNLNVYRLSDDHNFKRILGILIGFHWAMLKLASASYIDLIDRL